MASMLADTHAAIWFMDPPGRLSPTALAAMRATVASGDAINVSAITIVELVYLVDKGRIPPQTLVALYALIDSQDSAFTLVPVDLDVARRVERIPRDQVPDMPDRIIAATALTLGLPLVTRDAEIQASLVQTIW